MSENNLPNEEFNEEVTEAVEEIVEEVAEEAVEEAEEVAEEAVETVEEVPESEIVFDGDFQKPVKNYKTSAIVAWILVAVLVLVDVGYFITNIFNVYNHMGYLNISGYTIGDIVSGMGMDFEEFKKMYSLPKGMREDTYMEVAQSLIPVGTMARLNNQTVDELKEMYGFGDEITSDNTWGEAVESLDMRSYVGEEQFEQFKAEYELGDEVTLDTKWGTIRKKVEKKQMEQKILEEKRAEEAQKLAEEEANNQAEEDALAEADVPEAEGEGEAPEGETPEVSE